MAHLINQISKPSLALHKYFCYNVMLIYDTLYNINNIKIISNVTFQRKLPFIRTKDNFRKAARIVDRPTCLIYYQKRQLLKCGTGMYAKLASIWWTKCEKASSELCFQDRLLGRANKKIFYAATLEDKYLSISIIYLSVSLSVFFVYLSIYLSIYLSTIYLPIYRSSHRQIWLFSSSKVRASTHIVDRYIDREKYRKTGRLMIYIVRYLSSRVVGQK